MAHLRCIGSYFRPVFLTYLLGMVGRLAMYFDHRDSMVSYQILGIYLPSSVCEKWRGLLRIENPRTQKKLECDSDRVPRLLQTKVKHSSHVPYLIRIWLKKLIGEVQLPVQESQRNPFSSTTKNPRHYIIYYNMCVPSSPQMSEFSGHLWKVPKNNVSLFG